MIAEPIQGVQARAQATGTLLAAAAKPPGDDRWENGIAWRPETCFNVAGFNPCDDNPPIPQPLQVGPAWVFPQGYVVADECTTLNGEMDIPRLQRQADATASFEIAQELWTGALTTAHPVTVEGSPYANPHLTAGATTVASTATTVAGRLGDLEQAAMVGARGQQIILHVAPHLVLELGNLLQNRGDLITTVLGNVVVADAGYPGTGPGGTGTEWAYATGAVSVRMTTVEAINDMVSTLNRTTNRRKIWGRRYFAVAFDPCIHFAIDTSASA